MIFLTWTFKSKKCARLIDNSDTFFMLAIGLRFLQGFGDACAINASKRSLIEPNVIVYSASAFEFPEKRDFIFGLLEASYGVGFTLGPIIGQVLYSQYGFKSCFIILSCVLVLPMGLIWLMEFKKEEFVNMSRDRSFT